MKQIPYKYYFFGSNNSIDNDVLIEVDTIGKPHENIEFIKKLKKEYSLDWDINLIVVQNGIIVDTMNRKGSIDSINNSLFTTYALHKSKQKYENPIIKKVERKKLLAIYRCIRNVLSFCSKTNYRKSIKTVLKKEYYNSEKMSFSEFLMILKEIDFEKIDTFNKNISDIDIWKKIAFFFGQTNLLLEDIEVYTKNDLINNYPKIKPFINRNFDSSQKKIINEIKNEFIDKVKNLNIKKIGQRLLCLDNEIIDVELEKNV